MKQTVNYELVVQGLMSPAWTHMLPVSAFPGKLPVSLWEALVYLHPITPSRKTSSLFRLCLWKCPMASQIFFLTVVSLSITKAGQSRKGSLCSIHWSWRIIMSRRKQTHTTTGLVWFSSLNECTSASQKYPSCCWMGMGERRAVITQRQSQ